MGKQKRNSHETEGMSSQHHCPCVQKAKPSELTYISQRGQALDGKSTPCSQLPWMHVGIDAGTPLTSANVS